MQFAAVGSPNEVARPPRAGGLSLDRRRGGYDTSRRRMLAFVQSLALALGLVAASGSAAPAPCEYGEYIEPPCEWPSRPPAGRVPFPASSSVAGITILENATAIKNYGADTWYPAEDRHGDLFSGFDDGAVLNVSVGSACTRPRPKCASGEYGFHTGSAVVSGSDWRSLSVSAPGGAIFEDGFPMQGRYTCANAVANGTWWVGTCELTSKYLSARTALSQPIPRLTVRGLSSAPCVQMV
eukprot:COSAG03_NODE_810_length_5761_cov_6.315613_3_plen_239_part_00